MDGRTLMEIMQSPNFSMWAPAEQAFNTTQEKAKADLATTLGLEQRNQAMHPLQMQNTQAVTRLNNSTAATNEDNLKAQLPAEKRLQLKMSQFFKESDELTQEQTRMQVQRTLQLARMAKDNGGVLPEWVNVEPEEMNYYSPANLDRTIKYGETFFASDPKEIAARQRAAEALKLEEKRAQGRIDLKSIAAPGGGTPKSAKSPQELMTYYTELANKAKPGSEEQKQYLAMAAAEWQKMQMLAILKAQAGGGGKIDPVATAETGEVTSRPQVTPQPMPQAGGAWTPPNGWK